MSRRSASDLRRLFVVAAWCALAIPTAALGGCAEHDGPAEIARARSTGTMVSATIVSAEDTRSRRDALHFVRFKLRVQSDGGERVIDSTTLLNPYDFQRYPPGASVRCRLLGDNPAYFAFAD